MTVFNSYSIGEVSTLLNLSRDMIRYYEKQGAIRASRGAENNYRRYDSMEVFWLLEAMQHKSWGVPISEISGIRNHEYTINTEQFLGEEVRRIRQNIHYQELLAQRLEQLRLNPDVRMALLDIMLPDMDGFEVCRRIRASNSKIGIIMLTARTQEMDKVTGFMTGADDYVTKPFSPAELTARIDALYRRTGGETMDDGEIQQTPFVLNTRKRTLEKNGQRVKLTQVEYAIIKMFMENPGKALSREEILKFVWGENYLGELKIVDVNIRRLRVKIEDDPTNPIYITTIWGYGYKWEF